MKHDSNIAELVVEDGLFVPGTYLRLRSSQLGET
jgi:hypothetical protein